MPPNEADVTEGDLVTVTTVVGGQECICELPVLGRCGGGRDSARRALASNDWGYVSCGGDWCW